MQKIEFNRVRRIKPKNQSGFCLFSKPQSAETRYKYISGATAAAADGGAVDQPPKVAWSTHAIAAAKRYEAKFKNEIHPNGATVTNKSEECGERIDIYYLDHGNCDYFATTDCPPQLRSERLAQQTIDWSTKFWAEFYGSIHICCAFLIAFILQTIRFVMYSIVRPFIVGILQIIGDYVLKPLLAIIFNGFLQPPLVLVLNILVSVRDICKPIGEMLKMFVQPLADCLRAFRLIEIHYHHDQMVDENTAVNDDIV